MLATQLQQARKLQTKTFEPLTSTAEKNLCNRTNAIIGYVLCSSLLLIANKLTVYYLPAPSFVLFLQLIATSIICSVGGTFKLFEIDGLEWKILKPYIPVAAIFLGTIYSNIRILQYCNVETFIVFRASTPILISIGDYICLGRELPSLRSWLCIVGLLIGTVFYMFTDEGFHVTGYTWIVIWYINFCIDQLYIKYVCEKIKVKSTWTRVYYTNLLASIPLIFIFTFKHELSVIQWNLFNFTILTFCTLLSVVMAYVSFLTRHLTTAAYFTMLGNVCKIITVAINFAIWDKHANLQGMMCLFICLFCAAFYQQAPPRKTQRQAMTSTTSSI